MASCCVFLTTRRVRFVGADPGRRQQRGDTRAVRAELRVRAPLEQQLDGWQVGSLGRPQQWCRTGLEHEVVTAIELGAIGRHGGELGIHVRAVVEQHASDVERAQMVFEHLGRGRFEFGIVLKSMAA